MLPTRLTVWLLALGLIPLLVEGGARLILGYDGPDSWLLYLAVAAYDAAVLLLVLADFILTNRALKLKAKREMPARLSVGVRNKIVVLLENRSGRRWQVTVRDEPPVSFPAEPAELNAALPPHAWVRLEYHLIPNDRGNFSFCDIHLRCRGRLGLCRVDRSIPVGETVQVYPNLLEVRRYEALVRTTLVRVGGYYHKRLPGAGKEFSHFRDYTVDDDFRHINWRVTARRAKPITSVYESEHSQDIIFCLDAGRMMAARVGRLSKLDHVINAVLMLTHVSQRFQDNLGLLVFSHKVHLYLPPAKGRSQ